jgi:hypothetical protein
MATDRLTQLDQRIAALRKRLEAAERMREAVSDDPELLDILGGPHGARNGTVNAEDSTPSAVKRGRPKGRTKRRIHGGATAAAYFQKVAEYLESHANHPTTIPEIAHATDLDGNSVVGAIYRTHTILFESHPVPGHATKKAWNLRKDWREILEKETQQK